MKQLNTIFYKSQREIETYFSPYFYQYFDRLFKHPSLFTLYSKTCKHIFDVVNGYGKTILDVGCGYGLVSLHLGIFGAKKIVGIDVDKSKIRVFQKLLRMLDVTNVEVEYRDILTFSSSKKFDVAICNEVISHVPNLELCLIKINETLKPKGFLYISDGNNSLNLLHKKRQAKLLSEKGVVPFAQTSLEGQYVERQFNPLNLIKQLSQFGFKAKLLRPFFVGASEKLSIRINKQIFAKTIELLHPISLIASTKFEILAIKE